MNEKNPEKETIKKYYVFDTYAILEIINGNINYKPYLDSGIIINDFIFAELCYNLIKENKEKAEKYATKYSPFILVLDPTWIKEAMQFRLEWKDIKVSMTDCIGYIMAKKLRINLLTGDKEFENMKNVEFVK